MQPATISQSCPFTSLSWGPVGFSIRGYASQQLRVWHMGTAGSQVNMKRPISCLFSTRLQIAGQLCNKWPVNRPGPNNLVKAGSFESLRWRSLPSLSLVFDPEYRICHFGDLGHFGHVVNAHNVSTPTDACSDSGSSTPGSIVGTFDFSYLSNEAFATSAYKPGKPFQTLIHSQFIETSQQLKVLILCLRKPYSRIQNNAPRTNSCGFSGL